MKRWYSFYSENVTKGQQIADQMKGDQKRHQLGAQIEVAEKGQQVADQLEMPESFGKVPWFHHVQIFCHCGTLDEALFYINKVDSLRDRHLGNKETHPQPPVPETTTRECHSRLQIRGS